MISQLYPLGHLLLAIAELFLIGWSISLWLQSKSIAMVVLPIILIINRTIFTTRITWKASGTFESLEQK